MKTTEVSERPCPSCGASLDRVTDAVGSATPAPGNVCLCVECFSAFEFGPALELSPVAPEKLPLEIAEVIAAVREKTYQGCLLTGLFAARTWIVCRGRHDLHFDLPPEDCGIIAPLLPNGRRLLAKTAKAVRLLEYINTSTNNRATVLHAVAIVKTLELPFDVWSNDKLARVMKQGAVITRGGFPSRGGSA